MTASHFASHAKQAHAARLGMWIFLAAELLLFAGLFSLYAGYRSAYPHAFSQGVEHSAKWLGSLNTLLLLTSSFWVAWAVEQLRESKGRASSYSLMAAVVCAVTFLAIKAAEYAEHISHGIVPGGRGAFFEQPHGQELAVFFNLYYVSTTLHALHVAVGAGVLAFMAWGILRQSVSKKDAYKLEVAGLYWHLVDVIWLFLWPMYYLTGAPA